MSDVLTQIRSKTSERVAKAALEIGSIKLNPANPFTWASGWKSPIYNDNRMFLGFPEHRKMVILGLVNTIEILNLKPDVIAGTSTAGIPWGAWLADVLELPFVYVRDQPKAHGLRNQIEGIDAEEGLDGKKVLLIEDLISTGGSSVKAVQALRNAGAEVLYCVSIFNYGFKEAEEMFEGKTPYKDDDKLVNPCPVTSLLYYKGLLHMAIETGYVKEADRVLLEEWAKDPANWGK